MDKRTWGLPLLALVALLATPGSAAANTDYDVEIAVDLTVLPAWGIGWWAPPPSGSGSFEMSGDLEDEGDSSGCLYGWWPTSYWYLTLTGEDGTLTLEVENYTTWTVVSGTGAYAGASGSGTASCSVSYAGLGTVYDWSLSGTLAS